VAIVWGLTFSTFLTLLLVPGLYATVDDIAGWVVGPPRPDPLDE